MNRHGLRLIIPRVTLVLPRPYFARKLPSTTCRLSCRRLCQTTSEQESPNSGSLSQHFNENAKESEQHSTDQEQSGSVTDSSVSGAVEHLESDSKNFSLVKGASTEDEYFDDEVDVSDKIEYMLETEGQVDSNKLWNYYCKLIDSRITPDTIYFESEVKYYDVIEKLLNGLPHRLDLGFQWKVDTDLMGEGKMSWTARPILRIAMKSHFPGTKRFAIVNLIDWYIKLHEVYLYTGQPTREMTYVLSGSHIGEFRDAAWPEIDDPTTSIKEELHHSHPDLPYVKLPSVVKKELLEREQQRIRKIIDHSYGEDVKEDIEYILRTGKELQELRNLADEVTLLIANREKELNGDADRIRTDRYIQELKPREESLLDRIVRLQLEISETEHLERIRQVFRDLKFPEDDLTLDLVYSIFADKTDRELEIEMIKPRELMLDDVARSGWDPSDHRYPHRALQYTTSYASFVDWERRHKQKQTVFPPIVDLMKDPTEVDKDDFPMPATEDAEEVDPDMFDADGEDIEELVDWEDESAESEEGSDNETGVSEQALTTEISQQ